MKVSLFTSEESFLNNYGAVLQGYALSNIITKYGYKCEIVRYKGGCPVKKDIKTQIYELMSKMYHVINKTEFQKAQQQYKKEFKLQRRKFQEFQDQYLDFWNEKRVNWKQLQKKYPVSDIYVCGSDQIWNPNHKKGYNDPGYFLNFPTIGKKCIAYAPSFACEDIPKTASDNLEELLVKFYDISVREPEGVGIIKKYTNMDAKLVADPTFLLEKEKWENIARIPNDLPERYILCYRFMQNNLMTECMDRLSEELKFPVITLPLSMVALKDPYDKFFDIGPAEFVGLVKNASLVCTDSFHATAFSLIMNIPFYTFLDQDNTHIGTTMNSRITNIIQRGKLEERIITSKDQINMERVLNVEFKQFNSNIKLFREESLSWLYKALKRGIGAV